MSGPPPLPPRRPPQPRPAGASPPVPSRPSAPRTPPPVPQARPSATARPAPVAPKASAPAPQAPTISPNQEIVAGALIGGRYRVERFLGRGGMGAVYAVRHINTSEALAMKLLNPALAENAQALERFRTEARAPVRIGTDHVVRVTDADVSPELGVPFLIMELLSGRDLGTELKRRGAIPAGEVVLYLRQVARALDKAHSIGIIHRDLKPANLYLTHRDDGAPLIKILDFGIAKLRDGISAELTQDGTVFGTPWYMSPEQARGQASKVGPTADLWALGLIAFRLLTGRNYWKSEGMAALIHEILYEPMVMPSQLAPHLGPHFDAWFARACNREPEQRFPSATLMVNELAMALGVSSAAQNTGSFASSQPSLEMSPARPGGISVPGAAMPITSPPFGTSASNIKAGTTGPGITAAPLYATHPPDVPNKRKGPGLAGPIAAGIVIAIVLAGGAASAWLFFGGKDLPFASTVAAPQPTTEATATASPLPSAPEPTAEPQETAPEPTATAEPTADPTDSAVAAQEVPEQPNPGTQSWTPGTPRTAFGATTATPTTSRWLPPVATPTAPVSAPKVDNKIKF